MGKTRGFFGYIWVYLKGIAMGAADVIPGVSGGTIALIAGVYEELVEAIRGASSKALLRIFRRGGLRAYWQAAHGTFLLCLAGGIATAIVLLAGLITHLLTTWPMLVYGFFFGLIVASIWFVGRQVGRWNVFAVLGLVLGAACGYWVSTATAGHLPDTWWYLFLSGAVAICAMILPGISGSFILLLLGKYAQVLEAVHTWRWSVLIPFGLGAVVGLLSFSHLLSWLLRRYHAVTMALLTGFMGGALVRVWPGQWGVLEGVNILWVGLLMLIGAGVVVVLERAAR